MRSGRPLVRVPCDAGLLGRHFLGQQPQVHRPLRGWRPRTLLRYGRRDRILVTLPKLSQLALQAFRTPEEHKSLLISPDGRECERAGAHQCFPCEGEARRSAQQVEFTAASRGGWLVNPRASNCRGEHAKRGLARPGTACSVVSWGRVAPRWQGRYEPPVGALPR